jgi:acetoin utilization deacetylase AcuC-like enzyme
VRDRFGCPDHIPKIDLSSSCRIDPAGVACPPVDAESIPQGASDSGSRLTTGWHWDDAYAWHNPGGVGPLGHSGGWVQPGLTDFETAAAKTRFRDLASRAGLLDLVVPIRGRDATVEELLRLHTRSYLDHLKALSDGGGGEAGEATPIGPGSYEIAVRAAGGAIASVEAVVSGAVDNAYALVRPPGHHAETDRARGYCLLGNTALAALHARDRLGVERIAIVDWDVHHGNGTEDAFYSDSSVLTVSIHADELYPAGRGHVEHMGAGGGLGANVNVPLPDGSGHEAYMAAMDSVVLPALRRFGPDLVIVASGVDASAWDPLGRQLLHSASYRQMTQLVMGAASECCDGRLLVIHEGGYSEAYAPFCCAAILEALLGVTVVEDPFLEYFTHRPGQRLQPHQAAAVRDAAALLDRIPVPA